LELPEDDMNHLQEILELPNYSLTPDIPNREGHYQRSLKNFETRCLHHRVFDENLVCKNFDFFNIEFLDTDFGDPHHLICVGRKRVP
jgi:hypothetical protein